MKEATDENVNFEELWTIDYDDLEIDKEIGKGAFGNVYKATYFGTEVAVKKIGIAAAEDAVQQELEKFLKREVALLKGIRHPNVVQFIGICHRDDGIYIVTEYVPRGDLWHVLKNFSIPLNWRMRLKLAHDVACAMAFLHSRKIIFRDLKSKNVLVDETFKAKVCDFGFARRKDHNEQRSRNLTICGTDDWMAPEVILGMDYDARCDIFSYGIVLFEIITRKKITTHLQRTPADAFGLPVEKARSLIHESCPPDLSFLAFDCCSYEPEDRPSFKKIVSILSDLVKNEDESAPDPTIPNSGEPPLPSSLTTFVANPSSTITSSAITRSSPVNPAATVNVSHKPSQSVIEPPRSDPSPLLSRSRSSIPDVTSSLPMRDLSEPIMPINADEASRLQSQLKLLSINPPPGPSMKNSERQAFLSHASDAQEDHSQSTNSTGPASPAPVFQQQHYKSTLTPAEQQLLSPKLKKQHLDRSHYTMTHKISPSRTFVRGNFSPFAVKALKKFNGSGITELKFKKGDVIFVYEENVANAQEAMYKGEVIAHADNKPIAHDGSEERKIGWFPASKVSKITPSQQTTKQHKTHK